MYKQEWIIFNNNNKWYDHTLSNDMANMVNMDPLATTISTNGTVLPIDCKIIKIIG